MNRFKPTMCALLLTITLSSSALAGNIGGLRTNAAGNIGGLRTSAAGNIGGLRTSSSVATDTSAHRFNIELAMGGLIRLLMETATLF